VLLTEQGMEDAREIGVVVIALEALGAGPESREMRGEQPARIIIVRKKKR
jgi:hypothetical protein